MSQQVSTEQREPGEAEAIILDDIQPIWLPGCEDIVIDQQTGCVYLASQARPPGGLAAIMRLQGGIYGLHLKRDRPQPVNLNDPLFAEDFSAMDEPASVGGDAGREPLVRPRGSFHPRGISLFVGADGSKRLFAINQRDTTRTSVEIFDIGEDRLTHLRTVADDNHLISVNDLVAVGPELFYATNDHGFSPPLLQNIELVMHYLPHLHFGSVVYFDGSKFAMVAESLAFLRRDNLDGNTPSHPDCRAIGIPQWHRVVDRAGGWLYVASVWGKKLIADMEQWRSVGPADIQPRNSFGLFARIR